MKTKIGTKIKYTKYYGLKCSDRFKIDFYENLKEKGRILTPEKIGLFEGYIVGIRNVIMSNYMYHYGGEEGQHYATGKKELCFLVCKNIYQKIYLVRKQDILCDL